MLFSISAGVIEFISFAALDHFTNWQYWPKYLIALILSVLWNFTLNREFTFRSANNVPIALLKALYLATHEIAKKWTMPLKNWGKVLGELEIMYPDRLG